MLGFEDLNLRGMQRLWGRKVSDLGFSQFRLTLQHVAELRGKQIVKIDRWEPTSQTCSRCGRRQLIELRERAFECKACRVEIGRDHNAARNIQHATRRSRSWGINSVLRESKTADNGRDSCLKPRISGVLALGVCQIKERSF